MLLLTLLLLGPAPLPRAADVTDAREIARRQPPGPCLAVELRPVFAPVASAGSAPADSGLGDSLVAEPVAGSSADAPSRRSPRFSAVRTLDLQFRAVLSQGVPLGSRLEFHVRTPQGHLYQRLAAVAVSGPGAPRSAGHADLRTPSSPQATANATLLVAGTAIVNHSLYGSWSVEPHLGGDPRPCAPARRFWLTP